MLLPFNQWRAERLLNGSHNRVIRQGESVTLTQSVSLTVCLTEMNSSHTVIIVIFVHKVQVWNFFAVQQIIGTSSEAFLWLARIHEKR